MSAFATVDDVSLLWRTIQDSEVERVAALLDMVSDVLRHEAVKVGRDLDEMIDQTPALASVAKSVTVDIVARVMRQSTSGEPMSQESQAALGYSWSGTYAIPGGGIANAVLRNDLKRLGLWRQRYGMVETYDPRHHDNTG